MPEYMIICRESAILACGFKLFITEEHVERFRYKLKTPLKITPLKNFVRIIPKDVVKKTKKCMEKKLFDEYVIFHLDDRSSQDTEKEKAEKRKDPIIFGKVQYSEKYYFIADWEDEFDTLTLKDVIKKLSLKKSMTLKEKIPRDFVLHLSEKKKKK